MEPTVTPPACLALGVEPIVTPYAGQDPASFVLSANLHRRHLTPGQQATIVAAATDWRKVQTVGKPKSGNVAGLDRIEDRIARSGASERTQRTADKVARADLELAKQVVRGELSLPQAASRLDASTPRRLDATTTTAKPASRLKVTTATAKPPRMPKKKPYVGRPPRGPKADALRAQLAQLSTQCHSPFCVGARTLPGVMTTQDIYNDDERALAVQLFQTLPQHIPDVLSAAEPRAVPVASATQERASSTS